jgi:hypothetical protein
MKAKRPKNKIILNAIQSSTTQLSGWMAIILANRNRRQVRGRPHLP